MWTYGTLVRALLFGMVAAAPTYAEAVRLEIISREPMNGGYELIKGRIHGEIDPTDPHNAIIQDIELAPKNVRGKVEYVATFALVKPADLSKTPRVLLYQVVNRGTGAPIAYPEGYISLVSGWEGGVAPTANNQTIAVPIAKNRDGSGVPGHGAFSQLANAQSARATVRDSSRLPE